MSTLTQDERRDVLVGRALQSFRGVADVFAIYLGSASVADADDLNYVAPLAPMFAAIGRKLDALVAAYRSGGGVSWAEFGDATRSSARPRATSIGSLTDTASCSACLTGCPTNHRRQRARSWVRRRYAVTRSKLASPTSRLSLSNGFFRVYRLR